MDIKPALQVLVTGGAGFIGSNLVKTLLSYGAKVRVLDNYSSGYRKNLEGLNEVQVFEGDIRDRKLLDQAVNGVEVVFHLAASVGNKRSIDFPLEDADVNVMGTLQLLEASRMAGVRKLVVSSSAGIFGELKILPIREDHPIEPDSPYGCTKLCEEKLSLSYARLYPMEVVCLRYFNVFGPNQRYDAYGNVIPIFVFNMLNNRPIVIFGDGEQTRDFIHVDDVVQANLRAAVATGVSGAFNIASGSSISINKLVEMVVAKRTGVTVEYGSERPGDVKHSIADVSLAARMINFKPQKNFEEGIREYVKWAESNV
jgi:nucleoside-diphosphate-sugar epimerase